MTSSTTAAIGAAEIVVLVCGILLVFGFPVAVMVVLWMRQRRHYSREIDTYNETGGARWGETPLWRAINVTWPFARLQASPREIRIECSFPLFERSFRFGRRDIRALRKTRGAFSTGVRIEHNHADYPPWVLFWTFRYRTLKAALERLGYVILDS